MPKIKNLPKFKNEDEEKEFWATHDSTDYFDWKKAIVNPSFPNLKPTTKLISIRMPEFTIRELKMTANKLDIPYQSLIKTYVAEGLKKEKMRR